MKEHLYKIQLKWTGNTGNGTKSYASYERNYTISIENKIEILGSSDPAFRGDDTKHNPEEMLLMSVSSCHMLWYLHFCSVEGIIVTDYVDFAKGEMLEENDGNGRFTEITLFPTVTITNQDMKQKAIVLHQKANEYCFIANSLNFEIKHFPKIEIKQ